MFWIRLRSGIILVVLAVIFLVAGGPWLWGCLTVVSLIGLYELYRVVEIHHQPLGWMGCGWPAQTGFRFIFSVCF